VNGLTFGGDTDLYSPVAGSLRVLAGAGATAQLQAVAQAGQRANLAVNVAGDVAARAVLWGDATAAALEFGPGNAVRDTRLYRGGAGRWS
jgi:hypothetical protein